VYVARLTRIYNLNLGFHFHFHFFSPSIVRLVNVLKHFSVFSTLVTFKILKIFKTTTLAILRC
jgi:hypothetical protein